MVNIAYTSPDSQKLELFFISIYDNTQEAVSDQEPEKKMNSFGVDHGKG